MPEFSFKLKDDFLEKYRDIEPPFGFRDAGANSLGEITFIRTYSRRKGDTGKKETWPEVCARVINGIYSVQKDWAKQNRLPWSDNKAAASAKEAYDRLFTLKWTPPGRGLWTTGTDLIHERGIVAGLYNCSMISTGDIDRHDPGAVFAWVMDALMLGVGVGFDTKGATKNIKIAERADSDEIYVVPDTREGWAESVRLLINSYLRVNQKVSFDYSLIRPYGEPIRGFGGTASGPDPLINLHKKLESIFDNAVGQTLSSRIIVDIANLIGVCVVAGNVRRSAEIALGDQNDEEFLDLKNYEKNPGRAEWGWCSNNTLIIDKKNFDYGKVSDRIADNGEPGFLWLDTMRNYGRLNDAPDGKDHRVMGTNPSLVFNTRVYTTDGVKNIQDLEGKTFFVKNLNGEISEATCWKSGINEPVQTVRFRGGGKYTATPKHEWPVWNGKTWDKKKTSELQVGDLMKSPKEHSMFPDGKVGTYNEGFAIGWNLGSGGTQTDVGSGLQMKFRVFGGDRKSGIDTRLNEFFSNVGADNCTFENNEDDEVNTNDYNVRKLFYTYGVKNKNLGLPLSVWDANFSDEYRKGLIDALFSSSIYAHVKDNRFYLKSSSRAMVDDVADLLGFFGVKTRIQKQSIAEKDFSMHNPDQRESFYYLLFVEGVENVKHFFEIFTLSRKERRREIEEIIRSGSEDSANEDYQYMMVEAVYDAGIADVWDVTVYDRTHAFHLPRVVTGNCAEISLESYELCNLVELHLNRHESVEDLMRTAKFAYLYAKSITLLPTHWPQTNAVIQRNRRIGTSMTGVAGFVDKHGLPEFRLWADKTYDEIQRLDKTYSEWLGIRESIRTSTVKPSGSVSLLSGATPGVHWPAGGKYYLRAIRFGDSDPMLSLFRHAGYTIEKDQYSLNTQVVYFPMKTDMERSEKDVSIYEKIHLAAEAQRFWSDNSVSVTVTFDPDSERDDIERVLKMHEGQLKTVSFLPMSKDVYPQMPYTEISEEEYNSYVGKLAKIDFSAIYEGVDNLEAVGSIYCDGEYCSI